MRAIPALDGWRAISIAFVVVCHLYNYRYRGGNESHFARYLSVFGVEIFFVISGFLITTLAVDEVRRNGAFSTLDFYGRRLFRILPAYLVYLAALVVLFAPGWLPWPEGLTKAALFACNVAKEDCGWYVSHSWSLAYEQQFYLFFPLLFALPLASAAALTVVHAMLLLLLVAGASVPAAGVPAAMRDYLFYFAYISAGAMVATHREALERIASIDRHRVLTVLATATCVAAIVLLGSGRIGSRFDAQRARAVEVAVVPLAIAWLVWRSTVTQGTVTRWLDAAPARYVGRLSYSLYVWQQLFTGDTAASGLVRWLTPWLLIPAAVGSYYLVERPLMRIGNRRFAPQRNKAWNGRSGVGPGET